MSAVTAAGRGVARHLDSAEIGEQGQSAGHVDDAAGRAASEQERRRAFQHLDVLDAEGVAGVPARIADAVAIEVVARRIAANGDIVALRAALAAEEGDARHVAQGLDDGRILLILDELAGHDRDALRGIEDRGRQARQPEGSRIIGAAARIRAGPGRSRGDHFFEGEGRRLLRRRRVRQHERGEADRGPQRRARSGRNKTGLRPRARFARAFSRESYLFASHVISPHRQILDAF